LLKATGFLGESKAISAYFGGEGGSCAFLARGEGFYLLIGTWVSKQYENTFPKGNS